MSYLLRRKSEAVLRISGARHTLCMPSAPSKPLFIPPCGVLPRIKVDVQEGCLPVSQIFCLPFHYFLHVNKL